MNISQRQLTINDTEQLITLVEERPEVFMGYADETFKNEFISKIPNMLINPYFFNIGLFSDEILEGAIIMKEFTNTPAWCWAHWVFRKSSMYKFMTADNFPNFRKILMSIDQDLFDEMEIHRKLNRFFFSSLADPSDANKLRSINSIESYNRVIKVLSREQETRASKYQVYSDCLIEPNTLPKYDYQKQLILDRTWPMRLSVNMAVLKS